MRLEKAQETFEDSFEHLKSGEEIFVVLFAALLRGRIAPLSASHSLATARSGHFTH